MPPACGHPSYRQLFLFGVRHGWSTLWTSMVFPLLLCFFLLVYGAILGSEYALSTLSDLFRVQTISLPFSARATPEEMEQFFLSMQSVPALRGVQYETKERLIEMTAKDKSHLASVLHQSTVSQDALRIPLSSPSLYRSLLVTLRNQVHAGLFDEQALRSTLAFEDSFRTLLSYRSNVLEALRVAAFCAVVLLVLLAFVILSCWKMLCMEDLRDCHRLGASLRSLQSVCFGSLLVHVVCSGACATFLVLTFLFVCSFFLTTPLLSFTLFVQSCALMCVIGLLLSLFAVFFLTRPFSSHRPYGKKI